MNSTVVDPVLQEAIDQVEAGLDAIFAAGLLPRDGRDAITVIRDLEAQGRRLDAVTPSYCRTSIPLGTSTPAAGPWMAPSCMTFLAIRRCRDVGGLGEGPGRARRRGDGR